MENRPASLGKDAPVTSDLQQQSTDAARPRSALGGKPVNLSMVGRETLGNHVTTSSLIMPCPVASAITVHHFADCIAVVVPIDSLVKTAAMLDLHGSQMLIERTTSAVYDIVRRDPTKFVRIMNEEDFDAKRFPAGYAQEVAAILIRSTFDFIHGYNAQNKQRNDSPSRTAQPTPPSFEHASEHEAPPNDVEMIEPAPDAGIPLASSPVTVGQADAQPNPVSQSAPTRVDENSNKSICDNCGETGHAKDSCKEGCWACGKHHGFSKPCPHAGCKCWCSPRPKHTDKECPKECRFCHLSLLERHKNPWDCKVSCCLCGSKKHTGYTCKVDCECEDRHLGQDCPLRQCLHKGCPSLNCSEHCSRCGVAWSKGSHRCQWKRVVHDGLVHLQCVSNPCHPLLSIAEFWQMREFGDQPKECFRCRQ